MHTQTQFSEKILLKMKSYHIPRLFFITLGMERGYIFSKSSTNSTFVKIINSFKNLTQ